MKQMDNKNTEKYKEFFDNVQGQSTNIGMSGNDNLPNNPPIKKINYNSLDDDLNFINIDISQMPLKWFYPKGAQIKIRAAKVEEIQAYSVVIDTNFLDVTDKMNHLLSTCVQYIHPDGTRGSYLDIKDGDRLYLIFMIRELTFQKGKSYSKDVKCECGEIVNIPFRASTNSENPKTFEYYDIPEFLKKFYNEKLNCFVVDIDGIDYNIIPPNIGIQKAMFRYTKKLVNDGNEPNMSFFKNIPFTLYGKSDITDKELEKLEKEYKTKFSFEGFQELDDIVSQMKFGLKGLVSKCKCGLEVHTDMKFPRGASSIFRISSRYSVDDTE